MAEKSPAIKMAMRNWRIMVRNKVDIAATMIKSIILLTFWCLTMLEFRFERFRAGEVWALIVNAHLVANKSSNLTKPSSR